LAAYCFGKHAIGCHNAIVSIVPKGIVEYEVMVSALWGLPAIWAAVTVFQYFIVANGTTVAHSSGAQQAHLLTPSTTVWVFSSTCAISNGIGNRHSAGSI